MSNQNISSSFTNTSIFKAVFVIFGLVALYYLYKYLFTNSSASFSLVSGNTSAEVDASSPIIVTAGLPIIYEGGEFSVSTWIYISDWTYRNGYAKHILSFGGTGAEDNSDMHFSTIQIYLGAYKPKLYVRLHTSQNHQGSQVDLRALTAGTAPHVSSTSNSQENLCQQDIVNPNGDSLVGSTNNSKFNTKGVEDCLLNDSHMCDLPEIELQRWVNITVCVNGKTVDIYTNGKLSRSCILPTYYKVDLNGYKAQLLKYGGFGGQIANTKLYSTSLNPDIVYKNYMVGPEPIGSITEWLSSILLPKVDISIH